MAVLEKPAAEIARRLGSGTKPVLIKPGFVLR